MRSLPETIGRFRVVSRIAQGGMGALYLAWDPTLERQIAIKLLRDDNDELRERFSNEARFVARLRHPRIVTIFDVGEHDGQPFLAMEYIQGRTLADIVREETPLAVPHKLRLIEELCDGLTFAHRAGIVHRDVKPANMIVEADGSLKILDFGIARNGPGMTRAGMLIGTLNYMSPEQVLGRPVDQRSDIFAVGGVLYELLTYRQAFPGGLDSGILNKILHQQPAPLAAICSGYDGEIALILERALEKDPALRYQDMAAMQRELQRVRQQLETSQAAEADLMTVRIAPPPVSPVPTPRPLRQEQNRAVAEALAGAEAAPSHEIVVARDVLELEPTHAVAQHELERRQALLERERALAAAAGRVAAAASDAAAVAALRDLLALDPDYPDAVRQLHEREAALERQQAEAHRLQLRQEAIDAAMARAANAGSHEAAIAALRELLEAEPTHVNAREQLETREAALEEERAAERRRQEIEAARDRLEIELLRGDLDAAAQALADAERIGVTTKALKPLRRQLRKQQAAANRNGSPGLSDSTRIYAAVAIAAIVLLTVVTVLGRRPPAHGTPASASVRAAVRPPSATSVHVSPATGPPGIAAASSITAVSSAPPPSAVAPNPPGRTASVSPAPSTSGTVASPPSPVASPPTAAPSSPPATIAKPATAEPPMDIEVRLAPLRLQARRLIDRGDRRLAVDAIMSGLALRQDDPVLRRMLNQLVRDATAGAHAAHEAAISAGAIAVNSPVYQDAKAREQEGLLLAKRRPDHALDALWDAAASYAQAENLGRTASARERPAGNSPVPPPVGPTPGAPAPTTSRTVDPSLPAAQRDRVAGSAVQPASVTPDDAAIRAVLQDYEQALSALDVDAVKRVYPKVNRRALAKNFKQLRALRVEILSPRVTSDGVTAVVTCQVRQSYTPHVGDGGQATVAAAFHLEKRRGAWIIVER